MGLRRKICSIHRKKWLMLMCVCVLAVVIISHRYHYSPKQQTVTAFDQFGNEETSLVYNYEHILTTYASQEKIIVLALVDSSFMDMTLNFFESSIVKHQIENYLFLALDDRACQTLEEKHIHCFVYRIDKNAFEATKYGTKAFKKKTNIRTYMILDALRMGFTVLHTDVDVVFMKNPFQDINCSSECDMAILWDNIVYNAGFLYIRPTNGSIKVYEHMNNTAIKTGKDDQVALNMGIKSKKIGKLTVKKLPVRKYQCGKLYFDIGKRYFEPDNICESCVVVHNNWIVTKEAKRYRFRETHLWVYDEDQYYTSVTRKYLTYSIPNSTMLQNHTGHGGIHHLKTVLYLGEILNRTVILPRFTCTNKEVMYQCPLHFLINIAAFDKVFQNKYRESSFLKNSKVPASVKLAARRHVMVNAQLESETFINASSQANNLTIKAQQDRMMGPMPDELYSWFSNDPSPVIQFDFMQNVFGNNNHYFSTFMNKSENAFKISNARQLK